MASAGKIPLIDLQKQYAAIAGELEADVLEVLRSCAYVAGKRVAAFEREFAEAHQVRQCVAVGTGTDALHLILWALDFRPGDEVLVPVNTYIATAEAVCLRGARPVFVDHDRWYNVAVEQLAARVTPKTRAVMAVHLYGQPARLDEILAFAKPRGLAVIEDCAQAHLAKYRGRPVGGIGTAGGFSFYPGKNLGACGEAGAVVTNDEALDKRLRRLRQHGVTDDKYHHWEPGHNYRMDEIQAAALSVKLRHLAAWTAARRKNAALYRQALKGIPAVVCPEEMDGVEHVYHLFVIQAENRDGLAKFLGEQGIATGLHYPTPLHLQPAFASLGHRRGDFPAAESACARILSLPMFPELAEPEIGRIADAIRAFYGQKGKAS